MAFGARHDARPRILLGAIDGYHATIGDIPTGECLTTLSRYGRSERSALDDRHRVDGHRLLGPVLRPGGGGSDGVDHLDALGDLAEDGLSPPVRRCCTPWCRCSTPSTSPWPARLLGGKSFSTLLEGDELAVPLSFRMASAHLDPEAGRCGAALRSSPGRNWRGSRGSFRVEPPGVEGAFAFDLDGAPRGGGERVSDQGVGGFADLDTSRFAV